MKVKATQLRANIFKILDHVAESGETVEVVRKGSVLKITPDRRNRKLGGLPRRKCVVGDPEDLVHVDWSAAWRP